jgi:hypothetical protein
MSRQPFARMEFARAEIFDVDADRRKSIDDVIDYFGSRERIDADPCGESLLDDGLLRGVPAEEIS